MRIREVDWKHYVCAGDGTAPVNIVVEPSPRLPEAAAKFWRDWRFYACDRAVIATDAGRIVGFFRFFRHRPGITAAGTWVDPDYRGKGLALRMWALVLKKPWIRTVKVVTVSRGGEGLTSTLKKLWPRKKFKVS